MADLMDVLPEYFRPVLEFQQLMKLHGSASEILEKMIGQLGKNCFVQTSDAAAIRYYEELFGINYKPGETLEFRRLRVLQMFNVIMPFSIGFLRQQLTDMFGSDYELEVDSEHCQLRVVVTSSRYGAVDLLYSLLWDIVPAHLELTANQQVTNSLDGKLYLYGIMSATRVQTI